MAAQMEIPKEAAQGGSNRRHRPSRYGLARFTKKSIDLIGRERGYRRRGLDVPEESVDMAQCCPDGRFPQAAMVVQESHVLINENPVSVTRH